MKTHASSALLTRLTNRIFRLKETGPVTVLVVDDEDQVRSYVGRVLRQAGYRTAIAKDAADAIRVASADGPFDLLLTDLIMPQMNGDELARRLRVKQPDLPVLYLTGFSDRLFSERCVLWEGEAFLDKPCTPRGLLEAVSMISLTCAIAGDAAEWSPPLASAARSLLGLQEPRTRRPAL
jgi:CheY-like chemotaxis protein